jgi:hypothetical protein
MRKGMILLAPLVLAGCVNDSASYYIDGTEHTLTVRAEQEYFWSKKVTLRLIASRLPDCQRQLVLGKLPLGELEVELFASGENVYTLRAGEQIWQVDAQACAQLPTPAQAMGTPIGEFLLDARKKLVFKQAAPGDAGQQPQG